MDKLTVLDLFSGIGGFSLGLERTGGFETIQFCEIDPFCRKVLAKHWPNVPCHDDITTMEFREGQADVITGGFPCQDLSYAGRGAGLAGERSGLWRELHRAICVVRPRYALIENVAALLSRGLGAVLSDLAQIGYDAEWHCIRAWRCGRPHNRDRLWIVAYPYGSNVERFDNKPESRFQQIRKYYAPEIWNWENELSTPRICGTGDGLPSRVDRTAALGNAVVPQIPELLGNAILDYERCAAA